MSTTPSQIDDDRLQLFINAINLGPAPTRAEDMTEDVWARVRASYERQKVVYAKLILEHCRADPARLVAAGLAAQHERDTFPPSDRKNRATWTTGAQLAETALQLVRDAGGEHDPARRNELLGQVAAEWFPEHEPPRQGLWHRHRWPRRLLRRASPWWWWHRLSAYRATLRHQPAPVECGFQDLTIHLGGQQVGYLTYQVCHTCRRALVAKMSIDVTQQGRGLGSRALRRARAQVPGYTWYTTAQYDTARSFWDRVGLADSEVFERACQHMNDAINTRRNTEVTVTP